MPVIRYKRKRPMKTRGRITNQIISHDFRGFTIINVVHVSYGQHSKMLKVIIIYLQGHILPGLSSTFELMTSPEVTWLLRSYARQARNPDPRPSLRINASRVLPFKIVWISRPPYLKSSQLRRLDV